MDERVLVWFSCGAASAVAAKLALARYGDRVTVVYCDTSADEHPDNRRFFEDVQTWLGVPIQRIQSDKYASVQEVFEQRRYMSGIAGAPCSGLLKRVPRFAFQRPDDIHVFGYTADEAGRIARFHEQNFEDVDWILRDKGYGKQACLSTLAAAGIELPAMYKLGYENNNCLGCVKATSPWYWNKIRQDFPLVFEARATLSRELGARLVRVDGERIFLDELAEGVTEGEREDVSCGPECGQLVLL